jgi:hypothetical protein
MEEAKVSFNVKFRMQGFECQLTQRGDEEGSGPAITRAQATVRILAGIVGVTPTNGNGQHAAAPVPPASPRGAARRPGPSVPPAPLFEEEPAAPVCPHCGQSDELELIPFEKDGKPRKAWKCHRCEKWLPSKK